jgi:predicted ribosomally synthesized peptide with nif11-like leader
MLAILTIGANLDLSLALIVMSAEQLTAFWEAVEGDTSLQEKLSASTDGEIDTPIEAQAVVAIAKEAGFTITAGDLLKADAQAILELNDEDLEKVAGGLWGIRGTEGQTAGSVWRNGKMWAGGGTGDYVSSRNRSGLFG